MLVNFKAIWSILQPFGTFNGNFFGTFFGLFGIFFPFWHVVPRQIWQPCSVYNLGSALTIAVSNKTIEIY
jgi:hypothetical protein